jgi:hypothetical protein
MAADTMANEETVARLRSLADPLMQQAADELERVHRQYQRAIWCLQDIAALAGTTKRKQAGCEMAAHMLAQLIEPRERDGD